MRHKSFPSLSTRRQGFTLVELMIAIAVSAILLLGVVQVFVYSRHAYKLDNGLADAQENARFAVHSLSEDIRMAGYIGCQGVNVTNTLNNQTNWMFDFNTPLQGWDNNPNASYPPPAAFASLNPPPVPYTDVLVVLRGSDSNYRVTASHGASQANQNSASFSLNTAVGLSQYDIVMVSDCRQASVFQITNNPTGNAANTVDHITGTTSAPPGNCSQNMGGTIPQTGCSVNSGSGYFYQANASMLKLIATGYYIGTTASGTNALYRVSMDKGVLGTPQELAAGIENMQILYGVDTTGDKVANQYVSADALRAEITSGTLPQGFDAVGSVRLGLLVDTTTDITKGQVDNKTYTIAGTSIGPVGGSTPITHPADNKLRFAITTTIKIRR